MLSRFLSCFFILLMTFSVFASDSITVGSKRFTESFILGEIISQFLEDKGYLVKRRFGLGGTMIAYDALRTKEIDIYPEYTGTLFEAVFKTSDPSPKQLKSNLAKDSIEPLESLGFNNAYCLVMKKERAQQLGITSISDLSQHPNLVGAISAEFGARKDGWPELSKLYNLTQKTKRIEVPLNYKALYNDVVDFSEAYSTEPLIVKNSFIVLEDNKDFFPLYEALPLIHKDVPEAVKNHLKSLANVLSNESMTELNAKATNGITFAQIAKDFLVEKNLIKANNQKSFSSLDWRVLLLRTKEHLYLTCLAVLLATLIAVPLASFIASRNTIAQPVLALTGLLQTIPSIALLTFMIPIAGIGFKPALLGLFIYSLLPIVRNTYTAMRGIDPKLILAARGIGLYPWEIFYSVKLPLSFPMILAGIRTATILNIGTATLAAFIGAGGLGEPIVTGLALNDTGVILQGAIPAALLAIAIDFLFGLVNKLFNREL